MSTSDLAKVIDLAHEGLDAFMRGDSGPVLQLFSQRPDVTLANPFGPPARGWDEVFATAERAATHYREGEAVGFDRISAYESPELGYIVEIERLKARVGGAAELTPLSLRVTTIFRREEGDWKICHRHADPITTTRGADSVIGT